MPRLDVLAMLERELDGALPLLGTTGKKRLPLAGALWMPGDGSSHADAAKKMVSATDVCCRSAKKLMRAV